MKAASNSQLERKLIYLF